MENSMSFKELNKNINEYNLITKIIDFVGEETIEEQYERLKDKLNNEDIYNKEKLSYEFLLEYGSKLNMNHLLKNQKNIEIEKYLLELDSIITCINCDILCLEEESVGSCDCYNYNDCYCRECGEDKVIFCEYYEDDHCEDCYYDCDSCRDRVQYELKMKSLKNKNNYILELFNELIKKHNLEDEDLTKDILIELKHF
jgi:hypothetical protein